MTSLLIAVSLLCIGTAQYVMPLRRIESQREYLTRINRQDLIVHGLHRPYILKTSGYEPEIDYHDLWYVSNVSIGAPSPTFVVAMDTGSSTLWVPAASCKNGGCSYKHKHNCTASNTCTTNGTRFQISLTPPGSYMNTTGSVSGIVDKDVMCFDTSNQLCDTVTFGEATQVPSELMYRPWDGICGLAFQGLAVPGTAPPFIQMVNDNVTDSFFTVWMTAKGDTAEGISGGQITFGAHDTTHCSSEITYAPLINPGSYYQFAMSGGRVAVSDFAATDGIADTAVSMLAGPSSQVDVIGNALGATYDTKQHLYYVPCRGADSTNYPDIEFTINDITYAIEAKNYLLYMGQPQGEGRCYIGVMSFSSQSGPQWILGDIFLREYCGIFDVKSGQIGFAKALM